jgi:hypothetical protein
MPNITVTRKDGTTRTFVEQGRAGGSYYLSLKFENGFAVITDEWGKRTAIPADDILEIIQDAHRSSW